MQNLRGPSSCLQFAFSPDPPANVFQRVSGFGKLGDFTCTPGVTPISALAVFIGLVSAFVALGLLRLIGLLTNLFSFWALEHGAGFPGGQPPWLAGDPGAGRGRAYHRRNGVLRLGAHPRPQYSGGHRGHPDQWQPGRAESSHSQAALFRDIHRHRRTVRRRRPYY